MKALPFLFAAVALAACGSLPAERSIRIDLPTAAAAPILSDKALSFRLLRLEAHGALQERNLAYIEPATPTEVRQAATIAWEDPPESAAAAFLAASLRSAGADVIAVGTPGAPAYNLSGIVQRFELVGGGGTGTAVVAIDIAFNEVKSGRLWLHASYCTAVAARDRSLGAVEAAFDAALSQLAERLVGDIAARAGGGAMPSFTPRGSRLASC